MGMNQMTGFKHLIREHSLNKPILKFRSKTSYTFLFIQTEYLAQMNIFRVSQDNMVTSLKLFIPILGSLKVEVLFLLTSFL